METPPRRPIWQMREPEVMGIITERANGQPIDLNSFADCAYVRALHKRAIRRAIEDGHVVPLEVIRDYPDLRDWLDRFMAKKGLING